MLSGLTITDFQLAAGGALASHLLFSQVEPLPQHVLAAYAAGTAGLTYSLHTHRHLTVLKAFGNASLLAGVYTACLLVSIGVYRLFFHRTRRFPGPASAALSKWALVPVDAAGTRPYYLRKLHKQYGDIVRTGPREISVLDPAAISLMFGANSPAIKGNWYTAVHAGLPKRSLSLHATVDPQDHAARRRIWDQGFKTSALKSYEPTLTRLVGDLMQRLEEQVGQEVKIDEWVSYLSFDMMSSLGFSKNTDLISQGKLNKAIHLLEEAMSMINLLGGISYMAYIARWLPNPIVDFEKFTETALDERVKTGASEPDLLSYLLGEDKETGWKHTREELISDCGLIIVAGSDTTSLSMGMAMFELTRNPSILRKVADEMDAVFGSDPAENFDKLQKDCPYLNAFIHEVLRIHPPVMSGLQRTTPPQGMTLKNTFIPGNTTVTIPTFAMHRDERNFSRPDEFLPERWLDARKAGLENHNPKALNTFSYGNTGCIGRGLAMMELRAVVGSFAQLFESKWAPGFNPGADWTEKNLLDTFTVKKLEPIRVVLSLRKDRKRA